MIASGCTGSRTDRPSSRTVRASRQPSLVLQEQAEGDAAPGRASRRRRRGGPAPPPRSAAARPGRLAGLLQGETPVAQHLTR